MVLVSHSSIKASFSCGKSEVDIGTSKHVSLTSTKDVLLGLNQDLTEAYSSVDGSSLGWPQYGSCFV